MTKIRLVASLALLASAAPTARAQSLSDFAGYLALTLTPQGGLPASAFGAEAATTALTVDARYGRLSYESDDVTNFFGLSVSAPAGGGRFGGTVGAATCDGCDAIAMLGVHYEQALVVQRSEGTAFALGIQPALGVAKSTGDGEGTAMSASIGVPMSVSAGAATRITAFLVPGAGYGRLSGDGESDGSLRPMMGAGLRVRSPSGIGILAGFQKVFIDEGEMVIGFGLSYSAPSR